MELGKRGNDRQLIRQAVERLLTALQSDSKNAATHYNLACCYALLAQPDSALRHLQLCFEHDDAQRYSKSAANDPDLKSLRARPDFRALMNTDGTASQTTPKLPNR